MRCRNCGAELDIEKAVNGVVQCIYCTSKFTLPKEDITPAALKFLHDGESSLYICRFDDAYAFYKKAAELSPNEPEAYWGMAISQFKVQYVKDEVNDRLQPICHYISTDRISDNANYKQALSLATPEQRAEYERQAQEIDYIREEFYKLKQTGREYDCFICVKVTDDATKARTSDYKRADDIYFDLKGKGYNPFFSERELVDVTGADYEARILYALYTSECMIVVCGKEEYLHTKWVKNEYTRFLRLVGDEQKESDSITIAFDGRPVEYLPGKNGKIQGIDLRSLNASEKITKFVEDHTPEARAKRAQAEQAKKESEAAILKEIEKQREAQRELEERLKNIREAPAANSMTSATTRSLLLRANQFLADGEFDSAREYYNKVLDIDPQCAEAWFGLLLAFGNARNYKQHFQGKDSYQIKQILSDKHFRMAKQYATGEFVKTVKEVEEYAAKMHVQALHNESDAAWNRFLRELSLSDNNNSIHLDSERVAKIKGNNNLSQAYSIADEEQKAHYDEYMGRIRARVEQLHTSTQTRIENLTEERNKKWNAHTANYKSSRIPYNKAQISVGVRYAIVGAIFAAVLLLVGLGGCAISCINSMPLFGIPGTEMEDLGELIGALIVIILGAAAGGYILALLPLFIIFLPMRNSISKNNMRYYSYTQSQQELNTLAESIKQAQSEEAVYANYLRQTKPAKNKPVADEPAEDEKEEATVGIKISENDLFEVEITNAGNNKMELIKVVREYTGLGLIEAKEVVDKCGVAISGVSIDKAVEVYEALCRAGAEAKIFVIK